MLFMLGLCGQSVFLKVPHFHRRTSIEKLTASAMKRYNTAPPSTHCGWRGCCVFIETIDGNTWRQSGL